MPTRRFPLLPVAAAIAALAGFVDAYAFVRLGNFFVSFMSGNATRGGVALGGGYGGGGVLALSLVLAFLAGVILASIAARRFERAAAAAVMSLTALLIVGAAIAATALSPLSPLSMPLLAAAMGAMNGALLHEDGLAVGLTYMTGNLVRLGQGLADALMGERPGWRWVPYFALWLTFVGGAVGGTIVERALGDFTLWYAALIAAWIALLLAGRARRAGPDAAASPPT